MAAVFVSSKSGCIENVFKKKQLALAGLFIMVL